MRADARRNRAAILEAARALVLRAGPAVALDDIAREAGVGPGTLHRHFATKRSLLAAVVVEDLERNVRDLRDRAGSRSPGPALVDALLHLFDVGQDSEAVKEALAGTAFDLRSEAPELSRSLAEAMDALVVEAREAGQLRPDVTADDAFALLAGAFTTARQAAGPGRGRELARLLFESLRRPRDPGTPEASTPA